MIDEVVRPVFHQRSVHGDQDLAELVALVRGSLRQLVEKRQGQCGGPAQLEIEPPASGHVDDVAVVQVADEDLQAAAGVAAVDLPR